MGGGGVLSMILDGGTKIDYLRTTAIFTPTKVSPAAHYAFILYTLLYCKKEMLLVHCLSICYTLAFIFF